MKVRELHSGWTVSRADAGPGYERTQAHGVPCVPAMVPGHIHLDLARAGVLADPFRERFESSAGWVDESDWMYACVFEWQPDPELPKRVLRFEGLDTICTVSLNGETVGESSNFHLPVEFDVTERLRPGTNSLTLLFRSAVRIGHDLRQEFFSKNGLRTDLKNFDERAFVRKPGYMSGWDWGPRLVSCGAWAPVRMIEFRTRILHASATQRPLGGGRFLLEPICETGGEGETEIRFDGDRIDGPVELTPEPWWPNGEGPQRLHEVEFKLGDHRIVRRVGFRTVELVREPDEFGTSFAFVVNGRRIWCRGANWIPHDSFPSRANADAPAAVQRYARLGMNMLRVWGGGMYESECFYDACDETGILVWQDFPYACSYYPDGDDHLRRAAVEAAQHVMRLRDRASLAIWCGNNEIRSMWHGKWGGEATAPDRLYGEAIWDEVLPAVVAEHDRTRPYIESSPVLVPGMVDDAPSHSDDHFWDVWHGRGDWTHYAESTARFSSEFGFASSCSSDVWRSVSDRELTPEDPTVRWHDKTNKPWDTFRGFVELHYPKAESLEEWIYFSQLNQRDAMRAAIEHYRSGERCRGALIWQANDCWPVQSWALEDYARNLKAAGFELRRLYAPVMLRPFFEHGRVQAIVANDGPTAYRGRIQIEIVDTESGATLASCSQELVVGPGERVTSSGFDAPSSRRDASAVRFTLEDVQDSERWLIPCEPKDLRIAPPVICAQFRDGKLAVSVQGLALDLVVWDDGSASNLVEPSSGLSGMQPRSGVGLEFILHGKSVPHALKARSLAGPHEVRLSTV